MAMLSMALKTSVVIMSSMLVMLGSPAFAQSNPYPCMTRLDDVVCASNSSGYIINNEECCQGIQSEIETEPGCMCDAIAASLTNVYNTVKFCETQFGITELTCDSTSVPVAPPARKSVGTIVTVIYIVFPLLVVIVVVSIYCICKGPNRTIIPHQNFYGGEQDHNVLMYGNGSESAIDLTPMYTVPLTPTPLKTAESMHYNLVTIQIATNNFSKDNEIGRGGFGSVYKGFLPDGKEIAVKRLSDGKEIAAKRLSKDKHGQGDKEFNAEIELLAKLQHKNVVRLLGFCMTEDEALLVYEFMPNNSLDHFIFDGTKRGDLQWPMRYGIIKGIARGMLYIQEDSPITIVHRDLKGANVLLDANMNPKIADFGTARICDLDGIHANATRVMGTQGYMSPEYLHHGKFSVKSDVYAFGVILLEIVSGRRIGRSSKQQQSGEPNQDLMTYAWRCWEEEKPLEFTDPLLKGSISSGEVIRCVHLGLLCVQDNPNMRPSMSTIVQTLNSNYVASDLPKPKLPRSLYDFTTDDSSPSATTQSEFGTTGTNNSSWAFPGYNNGR